MKNLPLLLLGAGAVFLVAKKPAKVSTKESLTIAPGQIGSKDQGYKIVDCKLTIYDKQKAFDYAFKLGADGAEPNNVDEYTWSTKPLKKKLVGECIDAEILAKLLMSTKEKAFFIFELFKYLLSGITSKSEVYTSDQAIESIQQFKDNVQKLLGYDTSAYKVELIELQYN
jgi:hypothetical protein